MPGQWWPFKIHLPQCLFPVCNEDITIHRDGGWKSGDVVTWQVVWNSVDEDQAFFPNIETLFKGLAHFLSLQDAFYLFVLVLWHSVPSGSMYIHRQWVIMISFFLFTVMLNRAHDQSVANLESRHGCWMLFPMKCYCLVLKKFNFLFITVIIRDWNNLFHSHRS